MKFRKPIQILKKDPLLGPIITEVGDYKLRLTKNYYQSLVESIITQQLSGAAAKSIISKFRAIYGKKFPKPIEVIKTSDRKLAKSGLSRMKISYIKDLSKKILEKKINLRKLRSLTDEEIIYQLVQVRGIGRWTSEMFLIFSLGRLDILPIDDLGLKKAIKNLFSLKELPTRDQIENYSLNWKPYRTIATWYLWKSLKKFDTIG